MQMFPGECGDPRGIDVSPSHSCQFRPSLRRTTRTRRETRHIFPDPKINKLLDGLVDRRVQLARALLIGDNTRRESVLNDLNKDLESMRIGPVTGTTRIEAQAVPVGRISKGAGWRGTANENFHTMSSLNVRRPSMRTVRGVTDVSGSGSRGRSWRTSADVDDMEEEGKTGLKRHLSSPSPPLLVGKRGRDIKDPSYKPTSQYLASNREKWAKMETKDDDDDEKERQLKPEKSRAGRENGRNQVDSFKDVGFRWISTNEDGAHLCTGSHSWFHRLREFRERNKDACIARDSKKILSESEAAHTCTHLFRLNSRLFPSPVLKDKAGQSVCVGCRKGQVSGGITREISQRTQPAPSAKNVNLSVLVPAAIGSDEEEADPSHRTPRRREGSRWNPKTPLAWDSQRRVNKNDRGSIKKTKRLTRGLVRTTSTNESMTNGFDL